MKTTTNNGIYFLIRGVAVHNVGSQLPLLTHNY
jgi:hypothetical protein